MYACRVAYIKQGGGLAAPPRQPQIWHCTNPIDVWYQDFTSSLRLYSREPTATFGVPRVIVYYSKVPSTYLVTRSLFRRRHGDPLIPIAAPEKRIVSVTARFTGSSSQPVATAACIVLPCPATATTTSSIHGVLLLHASRLQTKRRLRGVPVYRTFAWVFPRGRARA